jgi:hypothetical protein
MIQRISTHNTLEQKLTEATISQEEQITLSKELTETREQLKQKQSRDTDNIGYTRRRKTKQNTTQYANKHKLRK